MNNLYMIRYIVLTKCWKQYSQDRPTFDDLVTMMDRKLQSNAGYLELGMILIPEEGQIFHKISGYFELGMIIVSYDGKQLLY